MKVQVTHIKATHYYAVVCCFFAFEMFKGYTVLGNNIDTTSIETLLFEENYDDDGLDILPVLIESKDFVARQIQFKLQPLGFKERGYDYKDNTTFINQLPIKSISYGSFSGYFTNSITDIFRNAEQTTGLDIGKKVNSGLSSSTNFDLLPQTFRKHQKVSYAITNQLSNHRIGYTFANPTLPYNFSLVFSTSLRYTPVNHYLSPTAGMPYQSLGYALLLGKSFTEKHQLSISVVGSYLRKGLKNGVVSEIPEILDNKDYNPNWGMFEGLERTAKLQNTHVLFVQGNYLYTIDDRQHLQINTGMEIPVENYRTNLDWYQVSDPRPNYYRYLPSYFNFKEEQTARTNLWQSDITVSQINWNKLYDVNRELNLLHQDKQAYYYQFAEHKKQFSKQVAFYHEIHWKKNLWNIMLISGGNFNAYQEKNYKTVIDPLGADYILNIDKYVNNPESLDGQYDIDNMNRKVRIGELLGTQYDFLQTDYNIFQNIHTRRGHRLQINGSWSVGQTFYRRYGHLKDGKFPNSSKGYSHLMSLMGSKVKLSAQYQFSMLHLCNIKFYYAISPPLYQNIYLFPEYSNLTTKLQPEYHFSTEANYYLTLQDFKLKLTTYCSLIRNSTSIRGFFDYIETQYRYNALFGVNKIHYGIEAGIQYDFNNSWSLESLLCAGNYKYDNNPQLLSYSNNGINIGQQQTTFLKNMMLGGKSKYGGSITITHKFPFHILGAAISASLSNNWTNGNYVDIDVNSRSEYTQNYFISNEQETALSKLRQQEKLPTIYTFDFSANFTWFFKQKGMFGLILMAQNLHNYKFIVSGYEDTHIDTTSFSRFPSRYSYHQGRRLSLHVYYRIS